MPTDKCTEDELTRILQTKTAAERLAIASGMRRSALEMLRNLLRSEHPDWSKAEIERESVGRLAGAVSRTSQLPGRGP
jgi:hypothetical protein